MQWQPQRVQRTRAGSRAWAGSAEHASRVGFWTREFASGRITCSASMLDLLDWPGPRAPTPADILAMMHPDDRQPMIAAFRGFEAAGGSFAYSYRILRRSGEVRWIESRGEIEADADGRPFREIGANIDVTAHKRVEEEAQLLAREMHHRVKNGFALMAALINVTAHDDAADAATFATELRARLQSLAVAHQMSFSGLSASVSLVDLASHLLQPWRDIAAVTVEGDATLTVRSAHVSVVALVLHELATNAVKYGALGAPDGQLVVAVARDGPDSARLIWTETHAADFPASTKPGFGTQLVERSLARIGGRIERTVTQGRYEATITVPIERRAVVTEAQ